jgi:transposase
MATHTRSTSGVAVIGIDIGKDIFHLLGFDGAGSVVLRRKIKRMALVQTFEALPRCIVGMEACLSAHFVSRTLRRLGFEPRIIPAIYVKPFLKGQKNDYNDAEAIAEAALRPNLRTVREKTQDQLDLQALHRVRARLVSRRTATINQIRAFLIEQGIAVRTGARALRSSLFPILEQRCDEISPRMMTSSSASTRTGSGSTSGSTASPARSRRCPSARRIAGG